MGSHQGPFCIHPGMVACLLIEVLQDSISRTFFEHTLRTERRMDSNIGWRSASMDPSWTPGRLLPRRFGEHNDYKSLRRTA